LAVDRARNHRPGRRGAALATVLALGVSGCGDVPTGGPQDVDERVGRYPVELEASSFPADQKLGRRSTLEIVVRNAGRRVIPNVAVTLGENLNEGKNDPEGRVGTFDRRRRDRDLSDPRRPQFVLNKAPIDYRRERTAAEGSLVEGEVRADSGDDPTYVDTYDLGRLGPGRTVKFRWNVTAVEAGPYAIVWRVVAGLDGRAKAVLPSGEVPRGRFTGAISRDAPKSRVDFEDGSTIDKAPGGGG
jgi:hypothetical protein